MYTFKSEILDLLQESRWAPHRAIDIRPYQDFFEQTKQPTSEIVIEFLKSFGELKIRYPNRNNSDIVDVLAVDPIEAEYDLGAEMLPIYVEDFILKPICIVAWWPGSASSLLMSLEGEIYGVFGNWVIRYGNTVPESMSNLILGSFQVVNKQK